MNIVAQETSAVKTDPRIARRNALAERWLPLVTRMARDFRDTRADRDDLISAGNMALVNACNTADPDDEYLKHHLARPIQWAMRGEIRRAHYRREWDCDRPEVFPDRSPGPGSRAERDDEARAARALVGRVLPMLPPLDRLVVRLSFGLTGDGPMSQRELARELGMSQTFVCYVLRRALRRMEVAVREGETAIQELRRTVGEAS